MVKLIEIFKATFPQLIACLTGSISAISDGMQYGWSAPVASILESSSSPVRILKKDIEFLETIYLLGGIAGLPTTIYLVNKIGRHRSIIVSSITSLIAWILIGIANSVEYLYVARFLAGLAGDVAFVAAPMYVAEIAEQKVRGFLAGLIYLMMLIGIIIIYSIAPFVPFYVPSLVGGGLLIFQLIVFPFMPQSPYYLLGKNKIETARNALNRLRMTKDNEQELKEIEKAVERQNFERGRPQDLILIKSNRRALIIIVILNAAQHFSGISVILMNLHTILEESGSTYLDPSFAAIVFSVIMLFTGTLSSLLVDKYGRKILLVLSSLFSGICLLILGIYFIIKNYGYEMQTFSWIPTVTVMIYAAFFKFGIGIIPIILTAELFSAKVKALGMTISDFSYLICSLLSVALYQWLYNIFGIHVPIIIFAICAILNAIYSAIGIPETKGRTLEEIQLILKGQYIPDGKS